MEHGDLDVVTGAFGYTGRYITERLLSMGRTVRTLTGHPDRPNPFGDRVSVASYDFEDRERLAVHRRSMLEGVAGLGANLSLRPFDDHF